MFKASQARGKACEPRASGPGVTTRHRRVGRGLRPEVRAWNQTRVVGGNREGGRKREARSVTGRRDFQAATWKKFDQAKVKSGTTSQTLPSQALLDSAGHGGTKYKGTRHKSWARERRPVKSNEGRASQAEELRKRLEPGVEWVDNQIRSSIRAKSLPPPVLRCVALISALPLAAFGRWACRNSGELWHRCHTVWGA